MTQPSAKEDNRAQGTLERLESELVDGICIAIHPPTGFLYDFDISMRFLKDGLCRGSSSLGLFLPSLCDLAQHLKPQMHLGSNWRTCTVLCGAG